MGYLEVSCIKQNKIDLIKILKVFKNKFIFDEDIEYYRIYGKLISEEINKNEDSELIYKIIFDYIVLPCIDLILNNSYNDAYGLLINSYKLLESIFINKRYIK